MIRNHQVWASALQAAEQGDTRQSIQKDFRVTSGDEIVEVAVNLYPDKKGGGGLDQQQASSAEPEGWNVSVSYKSAPDTFIFSRTFPTEREGRGAFEDISKQAAEVEGFIRQEDMEKARGATQAFMDKLKSNSSATPILPTGRP